MDRPPPRCHAIEIWLNVNQQELPFTLSERADI